MAPDAVEASVIVITAWHESLFFSRQLREEITPPPPPPPPFFSFEAPGAELKTERRRSSLSTLCFSPGPRGGKTRRNPKEAVVERQRGGPKRCDYCRKGGVGFGF